MLSIWAARAAKRSASAVRLFFGELDDIGQIKAGVIATVFHSMRRGVIQGGIGFFRLRFEIGHFFRFGHRGLISITRAAQASLTSSRGGAFQLSSRNMPLRLPRLRVFSSVGPSFTCTTQSLP